MSKQYLLDASALLALLQDEPGSEIVAQHLSSSAISSVNLAEVASVLNKVGMPETEILALFDGLDLNILSYDKDTAIATCGIRQVTQQKGLSLGDRACLAAARQHQRIALTADQVWLDFQQTIGVDIVLIR
jgi:PIN domain nuclease of toxin-antitoxin system